MIKPTFEATTDSATDKLTKKVPTHTYTVLESLSLLVLFACVCRHEDITVKTVAYIIHLERSTAREQNLADLEAMCPVPTQMHAAIDGHKLKQSELTDVYVKGQHWPIYPFSLRPAEVGVALSHRSCWKRALDEGVDAALILEDDVKLVDEFETGFLSAIEHIQELGYIQFRVRPIRGKIRLVRNFGTVKQRQLVEPSVVPLGMCAQLVSRTAAQRLLKATSRFDRPIDAFLQLRNITGQRVYVMQPSGVEEISDELGGSTVHSKIQKVSWINREFRRFKYRMEVRRMSKQYWDSLNSLTKE